MPPEGPGAPQADLFSLGMVLYEMSTGQERHQFPNLPPELKDWPEHEALLELNQVVLKACARDLAQRYPTVEAMHAELIRLQRGKSLRRQRTLKQAVHWGRIVNGVRGNPRKSGWQYQDEDEVRHALAKTNDMRHILTGRIGSSIPSLWKRRLRPLL